MSVSFARGLGYESGVQLNTLRDQAELPSGWIEDQNFAVPMRATRGRIDCAFAVDRSNAARHLGRGEPMGDSALNEAYVQVREALNHGAGQAIVARLHTSAAALKWIVIRAVEVTIKVGQGGKLSLDDALPLGESWLNGQDNSQYHLNFLGAKIIRYSVSCLATLPDDFVFAVKHLECFNDGVQIAFWADEKRIGGMNAANDVISLRLYDPNGELLESLSGSLDPAALDDAGQSLYLPNVAAVAAPTLQIVTGNTTTIPVLSDAYGYTQSAQPKWPRSQTQIYFTEGGTAYTADDYQRAVDALERTPFPYTYIAAGGSTAVGLLGKLAQLAYRTNRQFKFDVPGHLDVEGAIEFVEQLNLSASAEAHLLQAFWAPLKSADPLGLNPRGFFGTATLNIALACTRNAQIDARGFAPKHYPIAGREHPVRRQLIEQVTFPTQQELNALAKAKINPVIYETYSGGGRYVFYDSLTMAPVENSPRKLAAVADMSTSIDAFVTRYGKDVLQLPMEVAIKRMEDALYRLFEGAQTAGWLIPSAEPEMKGGAYRYVVQANTQRPYDTMDVSYWLRYDGTVRQVFVTQTLSR